MIVRLGGLALAIGYAAIIAWLYASQPQNRAEAFGGLAAVVGTYQIDAVAFQEGLAFFRQDKFVEARSAWLRADPARRDGPTQFYIAYSFYREGWGRIYNDDRLFKQGLDALARAVEVAPGQRVVLDDGTLGMKSSDELKAELERGLRRDASDFNPMRVFTPRK